MSPPRRCRDLLHVFQAEIRGLTQDMSLIPYTDMKTCEIVFPQNFHTIKNMFYRFCLGEHTNMI